MTRWRIAAWLLFLGVVLAMLVSTTPNDPEPGRTPVTAPPPAVRYQP